MIRLQRGWGWLGPLLAGWLAVGLALGAEEADPVEGGLTEAEVHAFLEEHLPEAGEALRQAREQDPAAYETELDRVRARIEEVQTARKRSLELAEGMLRIHKLEIQIRGLAQALAGRGIPPTPEEREELRGVLEEIFELRLGLPALEMELLEREIQRIKDRLDQHRSDRDRIVRERLDALLENPNQSLRW